MVIAMSYNYHAGFCAAASQVTGGSRGISGNAGSSRSTESANKISSVTISEPTWFDRLLGVDKVATHDSNQTAPKVDRVVKVRDGNASVGQQITGSDAEYYRTYQSGKQTFFQKIGTGVLDILRNI